MRVGWATRNIGGAPGARELGMMARGWSAGGSKLACVRACVRACVGALCLMAATPGCTADGSAPGEGAGMALGEVAAPDATVAGAQCEPVLLGRDHLRYIGRTLETHGCIASWPPQLVTRDVATGALVDRAALKAADRQAFLDGSRLHHSLRDAIAPLGPDDLVDVAIWLAVETRDLPDTYTQRREAAVGAWVNEVRENRMRASVHALAAGLASFTGTVLRADLSASQIGIPSVFAQVPKRHLTAVGKLPGVNLVMPGSPDEEPVPLQSINYFDTNVAGVHHYLGYTGNGVTVAVYEGYRPDSYWNLPGIVPGECEAAGGAAHCHCPGGGTDAHSRLVTGMIRTSVTPFGGIASGASTIFANISHSQPCTTHGLDTFASALNWATSEGASVINLSTGGLGEILEMFWDYKAATWPFPTMVAAGGNREDLPVGNRIRNGLVVGASTDNLLNYSIHTRHGVQWRQFTNWMNPDGWGELPHLLAPGTGLATAGADPGEIALGFNTSIAAPQVAAAAACMQDLNPTLTRRPHVTISGLMVGADINADAAQGGVWPLSLTDEIDDRDGTGQMNMYYSGWALLEEMKPTDPPSIAGHGSSIMFSSIHPPYYCHQHLWNVHVPAGHTLRAHSIFPSAPNCEGSFVGTPSNPGCLGNPFPETALLLADDLLNIVAASFVLEQNWQFLSWHNAGSTDVDLRLAVCMVDWNGLEVGEFALSWLSLEPLASPLP
jgi:hypothetical protein